MNHYKNNFEMGIVIPCYNEYDNLFYLLDSLKINDKFFLKKTLIIIVINNPYDENEQNLKTIKKLKQQYNSFFYDLIDCTKKNYFLEKEGVGKARAIGFKYLSSRINQDGVYIWLDADCQVEKNYLKNIYIFYKNKNNFAAWVNFSHKLIGDDKQKQAIKLYEQFLFNHYKKLTQCHTPYAYPTIGSTITCRKSIYEKIGGCDSTRLAGEDFYFLQKLTKLGYNFKPLLTTKIFPLGRLSQRVPFGTGQKIAQILKDGYLEIYSIQCYEVIKYFINEIRIKGEILACPYQGLNTFLEKEKFYAKWERIKNNSNDEQLYQNFHIWFDAFKIFKLLTHLSKNYYFLEKKILI